MSVGQEGLLLQYALEDLAELAKEWRQRARLRGMPMRPRTVTLQDFTPPPGFIPRGSLP